MSRPTRPTTAERTNALVPVDVFNNMIVNNVAGLAGGGISLQDAVEVTIRHNTIANNDSLATAGDAFAPGSPNQSTPQPGAGIVARAHSAALAAIPVRRRDILRSRPCSTTTSSGRTGSSSSGSKTTAALPGTRLHPTFGLCPDPTGGLTCPGGNDPVFDDLG